MKVIDLLNKIANGEEVPNKIKDNAGAILDFKNGHYAGNTLTVLNCVDGMKKLNDEIEIIEEDIEEDKPIEKIRQFCEYAEYTFSDKYECWSIKEDILVNKINEIIDRLNKLEKEGNK